MFLEGFPVIYLWQVSYSIPFLFIYKQFNIRSSFWIRFSLPIISCNCYRILKTFIIFIFRIYCCFFVFYPVRRLYLWPTTFKIYFMTFAIQQLDWIENKTTSYYWCFWTNLVSSKKWLEKFINTFTCIIIL